MMLYVEEKSDFRGTGLSKWQNRDDLQEIILQFGDCVHDVVNFFSGLCLSEFHQNSG